MERVDLFATVARRDQFVTTLEIPAFLPTQRPQVVVWGNRFFVPSQEISPVNPDHRALVEVFGYVVP